MRKIALLFAAVAALAVSCQKEPAAENVQGIEKTFFVTTPETRTVLDGLSVKWAAGDEINVIAATTGNQYTFTLSDGAGSSSASFTGTLGEADAEETSFYAVYPNVAVNATSLSSDILEVKNVLGDTQTAVKDGFDPHFAVMTAVTGADGKLTFRHGVAYFKITIGNEHVKSVNLKTANTRFQGRPKYVASTGAYSSIEGAKDNISLAAVSGDLECGATYYVPVLCKNSTLKTLTVTYSFSDGTADKSMSTDAKATVKLELGKVYDLGTPTFSLVPEIAAEDVVLAADATSGAIAFSVTNGTDDGVMTAALKDAVDWLTVGAVSGGTVALSCAANTGESRSAGVVLTYTYDTDKTVRKEVAVSQLAAGVAESHKYVFYIDGSKKEVNLADGETGTYFSMGGSSTADLGGDYSIANWSLEGYSSTKGLKMNSSGALTFTTSARLNSTVRFWFIRRKTGDSAAQIQLVPATGEAIVLDTPYAEIGDSGVITREKGMSYTIKQKNKEQALLLTIVNETE